MIKGRASLETFLQEIMKKDRVKLDKIKVVYGPAGFYTVVWERRV